MVSIHFFCLIIFCCVLIRNIKTKIVFRNFDVYIYIYFSLAILDNEFRLLLLRLCYLWVCCIDGSHGLLPEDLLPVSAVTKSSLVKLGSCTHLRNPLLAFSNFIFTLIFSKRCVHRKTLETERKHT